MENMTINTTCGQIKGVASNVEGVVAFKGIRYATAKRFSHPVMVESWDGIYEAKEYGNCCYQPRSFYDEEQMVEKAFYYNEFRKGETYTYSDDCLFLNIWMPEDATEISKLPVLFYIHGGGFTGGCGHEKHFDGPMWATKGVIAVTCNYRLGPLGFICMKELADEEGFTGNYGLYDQACAIRWVKKNIGAFGGDADNITIMGQSAGAMSVQQLVASTLEQGLISKAVMSSGGGVNKMFSTSAKSQDRYDFWSKVMAEAGCSNIEELRTIEAEKLFKAYDVCKKDLPKGQMVCSPCIDGQLIVRPTIDTVNEGKHMDIPYMAGSTSEDIAPPIIFKMAKSWCDSQRKDSYAWFFDRRLPGDDNGAWHSSDLWYWFGTLKNCWRPFEKKDYELSEAMVDYLCNFAKTGNPNGDGLVRWEVSKASDKRVLRLGEGQIRMAKVSKLKLFKTMLTNKAVGE